MAHDFNHVENRQAIAFDTLLRAHMPLKNALNVFRVNAVKDFHLCEGDGIISCGRHDKNRYFACAPASLITALPGATIEKGVISLDQSGKLVLGITGSHGIANFVLHCPGAFDPDIELT